MRIFVASACLFLAFPFPLFATTAAADVSAVVTKAEFGTSGVSVGLQGNDYRLTIQLVNSGSADSKTASVFVLFHDAFFYDGATQTDGTITTHGSALGQFVEWRLGEVVAGQEETIELTFVPVNNEEEFPEVSFSVSIVSPVSLPIIKRVTIGADAQTFGSGASRFRPFLDTRILWIVSFRRWLTVSPFLDWLD